MKLVILTVINVFIFGIYLWFLFLILPSLWTVLFSFVCAFWPLFIVHILNFSFHYYRYFTRKLGCVLGGGVNWDRSLLLVLEENIGIWFIHTNTLFNYGICTYSRVLSTLRIHSTLRYDYNSTNQAPAPHQDFIMQSTKKPKQNKKKLLRWKKNTFLSSRLFMIILFYKYFTALFF